VHLELSEDQEFFRDTARRFLESEMPIATSRQLFDDPDGFDRGWWRSAAELGWTAMLASEASGGGSLSGRPVADAAIVAEELGRLVAPGPFLPVNLVIAALSGAPGHEETAAALVAGEQLAAWAFGEPGNRWEPSGFATTAEPDGDGVVLSGTKAFVEGGGVADHLLVAARTGAGLTQVLVPRDAAGVTVRPSKSIDLGRRFAEIRFDGVRLPAGAVVGEVGGAAADIERLLQLALVLQCADVTGGLDRVFEFTLEYMGDRYAFGRPISSNHQAAP